DFVGSGRRWGLEVAYADEGDRLLGTGGAVRLAVDEGLLDGGFLVLYGDSYLSLDVGALWAASGGGATPVLSVYRNDGRWDASNAVFEDGFVTRFEKGRADAADIAMHYIDYGLSVLTRAVVETHIPGGGPHDLARVYGALAEAGQLRGVEATERFYEIGSPQGLADLEAHLASIT
ncbi:MAG: nucleotidyl transferase, partial [Alphaproteobacteria bacterium]